MQEMKKRRIVLASLLKPVDDTRMFEKLGATLASEYEVYVIGQPSRGIVNQCGASIISLPVHNRLGIRRLLAPWHVLMHVMRIKPHLLIVCTAELLPVALWARLLAGSRIIYDIQENYAQNIQHGRAWPRVLRPLLAMAVRMTEWCSSLMVRHFLLAEQSYADELTFVKNKFTVLENKAVLNEAPIGHAVRATYSSPSLAGKIRLLFSGTLAETTGVLDAIGLAKRLHAAEPNIVLCIIGFAAQTKVQDAIMKELLS